VRKGEGGEERGGQERERRRGEGQEGRGGRGGKCKSTLLITRDGQQTGDGQTYVGSRLLVIRPEVVRATGVDTNCHYSTTVPTVSNVLNVVNEYDDVCTLIYSCN